MQVAAERVTKRCKQVRSGAGEPPEGSLEEEQAASKAEGLDWGNGQHYVAGS